MLVINTYKLTLFLITGCLNAGLCSLASYFYRRYNARFRVPAIGDDQMSTKIVLLNVFGTDKPGMTANITAILARYNVSVLDISQAVIYQHLNLGMLIAIPEEDLEEQLKKEIQSNFSDLSNWVKFETVKKGDYAHWMRQQGKEQRHIVTLLARLISANHIASLSRIADEHGLSFDRITRLTNPALIGNLSSQTKSSVEFLVRGAQDNMVGLRSAFMGLSQQFDIDIAIQEDSIFRRHRRLVCFDMDSTLIEAEVIDELAVEAGVGAEVSNITERAMAGELDFNQSFKQRMALLAGLDESVLQSVADRLPLTEGAERLFSILNHLGYKTAILSGGFDYFARKLQQKLQIDYVYANQLDIQQGKVTGKVIGERKAELLSEIAAKENIRLEQVVAVGDGANDLPMLSIAGLGIAFRAKPLVKASAKQSISQLGLDAILYLMGLSDRDMAALGAWETKTGVS